MDYEEVSQGGGQFKAQVLHKLAGKLAGKKVIEEPIVFDGYQIYDMAVVRTEMLPLVMEDEDGNETSPYDSRDINDAKGISKITEITKAEEDAKREEEVKFQKKEDERKTQEKISNDEAERKIAEETTTTTKLKRKLQFDESKEKMDFETQEKQLDIENNHVLEEHKKEKANCLLLFYIFTIFFKLS